jgi:hypothetical protein
MKNTFIVLVIVFILSSFCIEIGRCGISVSPLELSITMDDNLIQGNTSKKITIHINESDSFNVSWYIEHPDPIEWMRENKTKISDLSWVDVDPKWSIVSAYNSSDFYIHLSIPDQIESYGKHWETWVTFTFDNLDSGSIFNQEYAVRVYIDTPSISQINDTNCTTCGSAEENQIIQNMIIIGIVIAILMVIGIVALLIKKPKQ